MKTLSLIIATLITVISFSQTGKRFTTLHEDGTISERIMVSDQSMSSCMSLIATPRLTDTLYHFQYRNLNYQYITVNEVSSYYTKDEVFKLLDMMEQVISGSVSSSSFDNMTIRKGLFKYVDIYTSTTKGMSVPKKLRADLNSFLNQ